MRLHLGLHHRHYILWLHGMSQLLGYGTIHVAYTKVSQGTVTFAR